jgi:acyl-CoA reductase-like NAD-dependent aldehyde dehydrogenase
MSNYCSHCARIEIAPGTIMTFKLTYATMFSPPEEMHAAYEAAVSRAVQRLGGSHPLFIDGADANGSSSCDKFNPADRSQLLGRFALAEISDLERAVAAARRASPAWQNTPAAERIRLARRASQLLEQRVYAIAASLSLEVGKNRMEALGEAQEAADFFSCYAADFDRNGGFDRALPDDPLQGFKSHNRSVLKPYGVWAVIAPFNFPLALAAGPTAAALVTGNCVVLKGSVETPWAGRLLADCIRDAGYPPGVFNYLNGGGASIGAGLIGHPDIAGVTFTGSYEVGMAIHRSLIAGPYAKPCISEMGGKNACIVTANADLDRAAAGIARSAYGMGGQKCSALSRLYVESSVADELIARLKARVSALQVDEPTRRHVDLGPVISASAANKFMEYSEALQSGGSAILTGGRRLTDGDFARGFYVAPTIAESPVRHPLFAQEMFLPILMLARVKHLDEAIDLANDTSLGLTAGCYGNGAEIDRFAQRIQAGTIYLNRPQGATTGAWPGYQAFTGWKGSSSTGKAIGSFYYLPQYMREQSQTWVE